MSKQNMVDHFKPILHIIAVFFILLTAHNFSSASDFFVTPPAVQLADNTDKFNLSPSLSADDYMSQDAVSNIVDADNLTDEDEIVSNSISFATVGKSNNYILKDLSSKVLPANTANFLLSFAPDDYRNMYAPDDSSLFGKYASTFYGDETGITFNIGLSASNLLLDTFFYSVTNNIFSLNFVSDQADNLFQGMKVLLRPVHWLKLKVSVDMPRENHRSSNIELELNPSENTAVILKTKDNNTESKAGVEFLMKF